MCQRAGRKIKEYQYNTQWKTGQPKKMICLLCQRSGRVHWLFMPGELDATPSLPLSLSLFLTQMSLHLSLFFIFLFSAFLYVSPTPPSQGLVGLRHRNNSVKVGGMSCSCTHSIWVGREGKRYRAGGPRRSSLTSPALVAPWHGVSL